MCSALFNTHRFVMSTFHYQSHPSRETAFEISDALTASHHGFYVEQWHIRLNQKRVTGSQWVHFLAAFELVFSCIRAEPLNRLRSPSSILVAHPSKKMRAASPQKLTIFF
ncbi:hypothetical protein BDN72DRAFT_677423 [Pluteus cervinus]|uniref:Uncharacterized protein n=1 Tax=Pluteus cervinus TaxID=181527 RepID=A0ACD3ARR9_9AGAR|nr:hypothetical protein BDN72DRAFT_677423 [Pluteus cervinus]